jgi:hypothetical protein
MCMRGFLCATLLLLFVFCEGELVARPVFSQMGLRYGSIQQRVAIASATVRKNFPGARLFQVSLFNVVSGDLVGRNLAEASVECSFYIGSADRYILAVQDTGSSGAPSIVFRNSKEEPCFKGYPDQDAKVCAQNLFVLDTKPEELDADSLERLKYLATGLIRAHVATSAHVNVTVAAAGTLAHMLRLSPPTLTSEVVSRLAGMESKHVIVSIAGPRSDDGIGTSTIYFDSQDWRIIGETHVSHRNLPPGLHP